MPEPCQRVEPLLSAHVDGELDAPTDRQVAEHVRGCGACAAEVTELVEVRSLMRSLPVRRLPDDLRVPAAADDGPEAEPAGTSRLVQAGAGLAIAVGLLTGAAFSLGAEPEAGTPVVTVPMDVYVADHFIHTVNRAVSIPVLLELQR